MKDPYRKHNSLLLIISMACMSIALLTRADIALQQATAPASGPHAVLRLSIAGNDLGADAWPAQAGRPGYVEVWIMMADAEDYRPLVRVIGAPALEARPRRQPENSSI